MTGYDDMNTNNNTTNNNSSFPSNTNPPTAAMATSTDPSYPSLKTAKKEARTGKIESTVGKVLHSTSMKEKGAVHLENAEALTAQHSSLQEAEGLEAQAKVHRDRAEAHGMAQQTIGGTGGEQGPGRYDAAAGTGRTGNA